MSDSFASPDEVTVLMLLADHAQVAEGKLNVIGGGWSFTGPDPSPFAIAGWLNVPWNRTNSQLSVLIELIDADGQPVMMQMPDGEQPMLLPFSMEVGRAPGLPEGVMQPVPFAFNCAPIPLPPGGTFEWRLAVDGNVAASCVFHIRDAS